MIPGELFEPFASLGIAGLLFVMWWYERQERHRSGAGMEQAVQQTTRVIEMSQQLLEVVRSNTEAITALRSELRSHRASEADWVHRLSNQLQKLEQQRAGDGASASERDCCGEERG